MRLWIGAAAAALTLAGAAGAQEAFTPGLGTWQDRALIEQTLQRYIGGFDSNDPAMFASAFAPDAVFEYNDEILNGREAIEAYLAQRNNGRPAGQINPESRLYHVMTNSLVVFDDETHATHTAYGMTIGRTTGETHISSSGSYVDELEKIEGQWLITRRVLDQKPVFNPNAIVTPDGEVIVPEDSAGAD